MASQQWQLVQGMQKMNLGQSTSQGWQLVSQMQPFPQAMASQPQMQQQQQQQQQQPAAAYPAYPTYPALAYPSMPPPGAPGASAPPGPYGAPLPPFPPQVPQQAPGTCHVQRIRHQGSEKSTLGAVIVTISEGCSYDSIFKEVAQTDDQGTSVATYCVSISGLEQLGEALEDKDRASGDLAELIQDLGRVPAAKVVFNWECCSSCSEHGFQGGGLLPFGGCGQVPQRPSTSDASLRLAKLALNRGYMVMFSDFSLKALISHWDVHLFGPNPFRQTGVCSGQLQLNFDPEVLKSCSSRQLAKVGELCQDGKALIQAASNTIVYEVVEGAAETAERSTAYMLQILTTATNPHTPWLPQTQQKSTAGHVLLSYPSGGRMLTSAGHWKELVHLGGVSEEALLRVAERYYGKAYSTNLGAQLQQCCDMGSRMQMQQASAQQFVQMSAPY
ncbi:Uncharacterized protein SCF082_LOCUS41009 [Durusdinium trenchii]|uniref:Uncharacterized protein n=2 Tax=Durusdinium trenchii TaxID=1381693 RepID=A0ABP0QEM6_9DINO